MIEHCFESIIKYRCIQVIDEPVVQYVDYHKAVEQEEQEQRNGEYLVDYIIQKRFFPNGVWLSV